MDLRLGASYVGAVVGAGFASGQEHQHFFSPHRPGGGAGAILAGLLFMLFGWVLGDLVHRHRVSSSDELFAALVGPSSRAVCDLLLAAFMFCSLAVMLAGSGALFEEHMGLQANVGIAATMAITVATMTGGAEGLLSANAVMSPVMVGIPALVALLSCLKRAAGLIRPLPPLHPDGLLEGTLHAPWPLAAVLYVSYNLLLAAGVFASMGQEVPDVTCARRGGLIGGAALAVFLCAIHVVLVIHGEEVSGADVPMLVAAAQHGPVVQAAYSVSLWFAMVTTAVSSAFALSQRLSRRFHVRQLGVALALTVAAGLPARLGFASLIARVYPAFGCLGLPLLIAMVVAGIRGHICVVR